MMAIPTVLIGCLPTFEHVGIAAPILLALLRAIQGLAMGGRQDWLFQYKRTQSGFVLALLLLPLPPHSCHLAAGDVGCAMVHLHM
jgi:MFS family permease